MVYVDKGVVRLCGARSSSHGPTTLVPEVFLSFFFRERESEPRSGDNEENISELWKTETRVGSEGLQTVRNLRNDGDDRASAKFPNLVELYHS